MFLVEAMVERTTKYDPNQRCFVECEPYLANPCGSDHTRIIRDLKTVKGVENRIEGWIFPKDVKEIHISRCTNIYDDNTKTLVKIIKR